MKKLKILDLFCGRWGWSKAFSERGHECVGIDLTVPPEIPEGCMFIKADILTITAEWIKEQGFDFICASSPCEQFSVHGMKCFHPNPKYPELGLRLFNHTRAICEASGLPYIMENVRSAQQFVGKAVNHCGPFYMWGNSVPPLTPTGITKGTKFCLDKDGSRNGRKLNDMYYRTSSNSKERKEFKAKIATIPSLLSSSICDYAERICEKVEVA